MVGPSGHSNDSVFRALTDAMLACDVESLGLRALRSATAPSGVVQRVHGP